MSAPALKVTAARVVLSEWIKLRTLRSTLFSLLGVAVCLIGFAVLVPALVVANWPPSPREAATFDAVGANLVGALFAQIILGVLGVLIITGEYSTGMIRASLAAVPKRLPVLCAKAGVFGLTALLLTAVAVLTAFVIGQAILSGEHIDVSLSDSGVTRRVAGYVLYLTGVGVLGLALGALIRNTAGAISALFGLLFVVSIVVHFLPASWNEHIEKYLPSNAGTGILNQHPDPNALGPWTGLLVFFLYPLVLLVLAGVSLVRRDA